ARGPACTQDPGQRQRPDHADDDALPAGEWRWRTRPSGADRHPSGERAGELLLPRRAAAVRRSFSEPEASALVAKAPSLTLPARKKMRTLGVAVPNRERRRPFHWTCPRPSC